MLQSQAKIKAIDEERLRAKGGPEDDAEAVRAMEKRLEPTIAHQDAIIMAKFKAAIPDTPAFLFAQMEEKVANRR